MAEAGDLYVELRFQGAESFPAQLILGAIEATERAIARSETEDIDALQNEFKDLPAPIFDAMRYRIGELTGRALNFNHASSGSLILGGVAAALSFWLLDKTLGETVKQAWESSDLHGDMKGFLETRLRRKAERIARDVRPSRWSKSDAEVETFVEIKDRGMTIVVLVTPGPALAPLPIASQVMHAQRQRRSESRGQHES